MPLHNLLFNDSIICKCIHAFWTYIHTEHTCAAQCTIIEHWASMHPCIHSSMNLIIHKFKNRCIRESTNPCIRESMHQCFASYYLFWFWCKPLRKPNFLENISFRNDVKTSERLINIKYVQFVLMLKTSIFISFQCDLSYMKKMLPICRRFCIGLSLSSTSGPPSTGMQIMI